MRPSLALQISLAVLLALGIALGAGFYPALLLEERQLVREREVAMANLAAAFTLDVAARSRGETDTTAYRAAMERTLSVAAVRRQLVSLDVASSRPELVFSWSNPDLAFLKDPSHAVTMKVQAKRAAGDTETGGSGPAQTAEVTTYPDIQPVRVLVKGEDKGDLATLRLDFNRLESNTQMTRLKGRQTGALALAVLLIAVVSVLLVRQISRPVRRLIGEMERVARGDFDVAVDPTGAKEIRRLGSAFNEMALQLKENQRLRMELQAAKAVQAYLLPRENPAVPGFSVDGVCLPASEVGGDFYQYFPDDQGHQCIAIGDVSGKGMKAAMLVSLAMGALHSIVRETRSPDAVLGKLNQVLCDEIHDRSFITCLFGRLDPATGRFAYANAGHLYPYHYSAAGGSWSELPFSPECFPIGVARETRYGVGEVLLAPGDVMLLLSDGVVEARGESGDLLGDEHLLDVLAAATPGQLRQLCPYLLAQIIRFQGAAAQADDITAISIVRESS